jgi:putative ABC transport system ATP-binding protein
MNNTNILTLHGITFGYGAARIFDKYSLDVNTGEMIVVNGPSGCGKSTLLRLLVKLERPESGVMKYRGTPYSDIPARTLRRDIALLQQLPVMVTGSVRDNLLLGFRYRSDMTPPTDEALNAHLVRARLDDVPLDASAAALSVGQRQRIALIRLAVLSPAVLLLDEPTASLDPSSAGIIDEWVAELHAGGTTVILVTHREADSLPAGRRIILGARP